MILLNGAIYALIGAFAGLMAGILGIGGGLVVVPGLLFVFQHNQFIPLPIQMQVAAGTSLAVMILTSLASARSHLKQGEILWHFFAKLAPGLLLGTVSGAIIANRLSTQGLKTVFAVFLLVVSVRMIASLHVTHPDRTPPQWINLTVGFLIGLLAGMLGVGGGVLILPYLTYCGLAVRKMAPVSNLCTLSVAVVGTLAFMITGHTAMDTISYSTGYIYWPAVLGTAITSVLFAPLGAKLNYVLPVKQLKFVFIVMLLLTAINMLI